MKEKTKAVIYCRVSSKKQVSEGSGLSSQETRCREYAQFKGYEIVEVFMDDMTGSLGTRPGITDMLSFLNKRRRDPHIVIIDDISRLARDVEVHRALRRAISKSGATLESPSNTFADDPDSQFMELVQSGIAELDRLKNRERTVNRMKARMQEGYWVFYAPVGYRYQLQKGRGKILIPDQPVASVIREALEGFASGRLQTRAEVRRYLEAHPDFEVKTGNLSKSNISLMLTRPIYAGYIESTKWDISLRKGQHEGLISFETFMQIQDRLNETAQAPARKDMGEDFALRGFITCADCETPLRSCWSKGRSKHYPYYLCQTRGCDSYGKSVSRDKLEGEFAALLETVRPHEATMSIAKAMFKDVWEQRLAMASELATSLKRKIATIESQILKLVDRVVSTDNETLVQAYETKIKTLELEKTRYAERLALPKRQKTSFDKQYRTALEFLSNPCIFWINGRMEHKKAVLQLVFSDRLSYGRTKGFRTATKEKLSLPFKVLQNFEKPNFLNQSMVRVRGLEPPLREKLVPKTSASTNSAIPAARNRYGSRAYIP